MMHLKSINFAKFSSIKIGTVLDVFVLTKDSYPKQECYLIGSCNNILMGTQPPPLMILSKEFSYIKIQNNKLLIGAATPSGKIASFCKKNNIANFEFLSHLPGTLGGLVKMNAGLKEYEIFNNLISIQCTDKMLKKEQIKYGYRYTNISTPILEATFEIEHGYDEKKVQMFQKMRANQPSTPSAGSCFKNPEGNFAGKLIEDVGLKGVLYGDMCFSQEHANFLVNNGNGTFEDAITLIQEAQKRVYKMFNIWLECEIVILDTRYMGANSGLTPE